MPHPLSERLYRQIERDYPAELQPIARELLLSIEESGNESETDRLRLSVLGSAKGDITALEELVEGDGDEDAEGDAGPVLEGDFRSGFVAIIGRPNVGKSTLLNQFLGTKIAIVSDKPQTTRTRILGVHTTPNCQFVFLDTPGIHKARERLNAFMVHQAMAALADADIAVVILDGESGLGGGDEFILERVRESGVPFIAVLNKIDRIKPEPLKRIWEKFVGMSEGAVDTLAISARENAGVDALARLIETQLPHGPKYFDAETLTDRDAPFHLAELIREQVYRATEQELPYASAVQVRSIEDKGEGHPLVISAVLCVESPSQKGMMIGKGGEMLKKIGMGARSEMELYLKRRVFLDLHVEVAANWRRDPVRLRQLGYSEDALS